MTLVDASSISHLIAAAVFGALTMLVFFSWQRGFLGAWLLSACSLTVLWLGTTAFCVWTGIAEHGAVAITEVLRTGGWLAFLLALLMVSAARKGSSSQWVTTSVTIAIICFALIAFEFTGREVVQAILPIGLPDLSLFGRLFLSVAGLLLVENLLRNTHPEQRWGIKFLCFGVGGLFAYDFFMYADALLFYRISNDLFTARGITTILIAPLIAVAARRSPDWSIDLFVSRQVIFHSATMVGAGAFLLLMAAVGFYFREFGGEWGTVLQATFLFAMALLLVSVVFSGKFRAKLSAFISKHFFRYKFDYREEWLSFIMTISASERGGALANRILVGIANIVESPQGAIWVCEPSDRVFPLETWNLNIPQGHQDVDPSFTKFLEEKQTVINLSVLNIETNPYPGLVVPDWLSDIRRGWLIIPLIHHDRLFGFMLLGHSRAAREVDYEDYVLLTTVGRQAASYLAEREAARALAETQQFSEFNRRFAFVLHDIKNLVSQLSLMVQNAEKHKNNPAFQEDMLQTVKESVDKMNRLMVRLHEGGKEAAATASINLVQLLEKVVTQSPFDDEKLVFESEMDDMVVVAEEERLTAVISHLIDNAMEAVDGEGRIDLRLYARGGDAVIEVEDRGIGMDEEFIRNELFRPFRTTKTGGYGIGAYESREFVQEAGGHMDVISTPGDGTTIRICLPALQVVAATSRAEAV